LMSARTSRWWRWEIDRLSGVPFHTPMLLVGNVYKLLSGYIEYSHFV